MEVGKNPSTVSPACRKRRLKGELEAGCPKIITHPLSQAEVGRKASSHTLEKKPATKAHNLPRKKRNGLKDADLSHGNGLERKKT